MMSPYSSATCAEVGGTNPGGGTRQGSRGEHDGTREEGRGARTQAVIMSTRLISAIDFISLP